jgi:hypothetical protein
VRDTRPTRDSHQALAEFRDALRELHRLTAEKVVIGPVRFRSGQRRTVS